MQESDISASWGPGEEAIKEERLAAAAHARHMGTVAGHHQRAAPLACIFGNGDGAAQSHTNGQELDVAAGGWSA